MCEVIHLASTVKVSRKSVGCCWGSRVRRSHGIKKKKMLIGTSREAVQTLNLFYSVLYLNS